MAKKLKTELEVETAKAKNKLKSLGEESVSIQADYGGAAKKLSDAADKAGKSLNDLDKSAGGLDRRMVTVTRAFAGMAAGMAMSYSSRYFAEGSAAREAMDYGGAVVAGGSAGAAAGAPFGPWGVAAGAVVAGGSAAIKTYLDKDSEKETRLADFDKSEAIFKNIKEWQDKLRQLTESMDTDAIKTILGNLKKAEAFYKTNARSAIEEGRYGAAEDYKRNLGDVRGRMTALETLLRGAEKLEKKEPKPEARESLSALDSLGRVGGDFAGGDNGMRNLQRVNERQVEILQKIEAKTGKGAGRF